MNLLQLNKEIQQKHPHLILEKGKGYYYLRSDDETTGLVLASKRSTSIYVFKVKHMPLHRWMKEIDNILNS